MLWGYGSLMALMQELSNQGRVVGGHLLRGSVRSDQFTKGGLAIQDPLIPLRRHKLSPDTVSEWEELAAKPGVVSVMGQAAARAALPGMVGKALGAGIGSAMHSGHTVRLDWVDGKQSVIELPEKQFMLFSVLLKEQRVVGAAPERIEGPESVAGRPGVAEKVMDLASSVLLRGKSAPAEAAAQSDVVEQITKLASLHDAGILTDDEFAEKKAELLKRL